MNEWGEVDAGYKASGYFMYSGCRWWLSAGRLGKIA